MTGRALQPSHLRLLLHPIHILVTQIRQQWGSFGPDLASSNFPPCIIQTSSTLRFDELQRLLDRWLDLFEEVPVQGTRSHALMQSTAVLYHLIYLNLLTSFPHLEAFARGERANPNSDARARIRQDWIKEPEAVLAHCGQVLQLIRNIDKKLRPNWWSAAIYRIAIIMWSWGTSNRAEPNADGLTPSTPGPLSDIVLTSTLFRDPALTTYLRNHRGRPCLTQKDGTLVPLSDPEATLTTCIEALEAGPKMCRFTEGIWRRLEAMGQVWKEWREQNRWSDISM